MQLHRLKSLTGIQSTRRQAGSTNGKKNLCVEVLLKSLLGGKYCRYFAVIERKQGTR